MEKQGKKEHNSKTPDLSVIHKTFQQDGRWIERPKKTPIFVCECGNRYLKTRKNQNMCLRCVAYGRGRR